MRIWKTISEKLVEIRQGFVPLSLDKMASKRDITGWTKNQSLTHSNAELAKEAVCRLFENGSIPDDLTLLACGTSTPDQLLPSHASMVHGELANYPMEIFSSAGVCLTSLQAFENML